MSLWRNKKHKIWVDDGWYYAMDATVEAENIKVTEAIEDEDDAAEES